jgi:hypothetical protein
VDQVRQTAWLALVRHGSGAQAADRYQHGSGRLAVDAPMGSIVKSLVFLADGALLLVLVSETNW